MKTTALAALLVALARAASACSVCFAGGDGKGGLSHGIWWGIMILLVVTMSMIGCIGWAVWSVEKRREAHGS
jgi:hypothetical protein